MQAPEARWRRRPITHKNLFLLGQGALGQFRQNGRIAKNCAEELRLEPGKKFVGSPVLPPQNGVQRGAAGRQNHSFRAFGHFPRVLGPQSGHISVMFLSTIKKNLMQFQHAGHLHLAF